MNYLNSIGYIRVFSVLYSMDQMPIFCYVTVIIIFVLSFLLRGIHFLKSNIHLLSIILQEFSNHYCSSVSFNSRCQPVQSRSSNRCLMSTFVLLQRCCQGPACFLRPNFSQCIVSHEQNPYPGLCFSRF